MCNMWIQNELRLKVRTMNGVVSADYDSKAASENKNVNEQDKIELILVARSAGRAKFEVSQSKQ